ncbi:MAG: nicotinamidase [Planctomycetaceae bacterium]|nr:nicotinamidase [Planctomycetaceae bacterium]
MARSRALLTSILVVTTLNVGFVCGQATQTIQLKLRSREETAVGSGYFHVVERQVQWDLKRTALLICDMWDSNGCVPAIERSLEMPRRMNQVTRIARQRGATIIHAPSSVVDFYKDTPQRQRALHLPIARNKPEGLDSWCHRTDDRDLDYPIEVKGCCCPTPCPPESYQEITRQMAALEIHKDDVISASGSEIWNLFEHRGIDNLIIMGVHTNMCVLGRPFGIRNMVRFGKNVALMRDLTDTIYGPHAAPYVSHFTGTDLIVEHIERNWCPTLTSTAFTGTPEFRFQADRRPHIVLVMAEDEYKAAHTLPAFARKHLGKEYRVTFLSSNPQDRHDISGIETLDHADLAIFSIQGRLLPKEQLAHVRKFCRSGKPLIGIGPIRSAFCLPDDKPPTGHHAWPEFNRDILGTNDSGRPELGPGFTVTAPPGTSVRRFLQDVDVAELRGSHLLFTSQPLVDSATAILQGAIAGKQPQPVAWTNTNIYGGRVFYTSLGHHDNFHQPAFERLLLNAIHWALGRSSS